MPGDRVSDGFDIAPVLSGKGKSPRDTMFYYRGTKLYAVRHGLWKAHFITRSAYGQDKPVEHDVPQLYHLGRDPGEKRDVSKDNSDVLTKIKEIVAAHQKDLKPGEPQLDKRLPAKK